MALMRQNEGRKTIRRPDNGKPASGAILYRGPSMIDGAPIAAVATGLQKPSRNPKTGAMVQIWTFRSDRNPVESIDRGLDASVCGSCVHRRGEGGGCYVRPSDAPLAIFRAMEGGAYPELGQREARRVLAKAKVRLGAYGNPSSVPIAHARAWTAEATLWTGYDHRVGVRSPWTELVMVSVDSERDARLARDAGVRTARTVDAGDPLLPWEIYCPATPEGGAKATCASCGLCNGTRGPGDKRKSIAFVRHGALAGKIQNRSRLKVVQ